jgi:hypothetical protein
VDHRQVLLPDAAGEPVLLHPRVRLGGRAHDDETGRVPVQSREDAWLCPVPIAQVPEDGVQQRAGPVPVRGVHHLSGRLVEDEEPVVLVDDRQGAVLGLRTLASPRRLNLFGHFQHPS